MEVKIGSNTMFPITVLATDIQMLGRDELPVEDVDRIKVFILTESGRAFFDDNGSFSYILARDSYDEAIADNFGLHVPGDGIKYEIPLKDMLEFFLKNAVLKNYKFDR